MTAPNPRPARWPIAALALAVVAIAALGLALGRPEYAQELPAADLRVRLELPRADPGRREATIFVRDAAGAPVDVQAVRLSLAMTDMDMGVNEAGAERAAPGRYRADGLVFSMAGRWTVGVTLERAGAAPVTALFEIPVGEPVAAGAPAGTPAEIAEIVAGRALYGANCASCHGDAGLGDGPASAGLDPPPANFSLHMGPGQHTDEQIAAIIRDGLEGSAMPAWGGQLSEAEIGQLVAYLRTFAPPDPAAGASLPPVVVAWDDGIWATGASEPRRVAGVPAGALARSPAVAPGGGQLAFVGVFPAADGARPTSALYLVGLDGSGLRALWEPGQGVIGRLAWAPDGRTIYAGVDGLRAADAALGGARLQEIVIVEVATGAVQPYIEDALDPAVAPDGGHIAYVRAADSATEERAPVAGIEIASLDGSAVQAIVPEGLFAGLAAPRFSPDGSRVIFAGSGGPEARVEPSPLGALLALLEPPAAEAHGGASYDLWEVRADGSGLRRLVALGEDEPVAAFSPDGAGLVIMGADGIYSAGADGAGLRKIDRRGGHGGLDWAGE